MRKLYQISLTIILIGVAAGVASAQSFRVQCPPSTITHPVAANNNSEPSYVGPTYTGTSGFPAAPAHVNGAIKCQQISGGDGYATMGDGTQTYLFAFGPLSGLAKIAKASPERTPRASSIPSTRARCFSPVIPPRRLVVAAYLRLTAPWGRFPIWITEGPSTDTSIPAKCWISA